MLVMPYLSYSSSSIANCLTVVISFRISIVPAAATSCTLRILRLSLRTNCTPAHDSKIVAGIGIITARQKSAGET